MHSASTSDFLNDLARRLTEPLPGRQAHRRFSPSLAYGRHRGPASSDTREAAVAIVLFETHRQEDAWFPLTLRPRALKHHGGQISLPGGRVEPGETVVSAALREFQEELGPNPPLELKFLGLLSPVYVYASHNLVTPVVFAADGPPTFCVDPLEVEAMLPVHLHELLSPASISMRRMERRVVPPAFTGEETLPNNASPSAIEWTAQTWHCTHCEVWGATAMILAELAAICSFRRQTVVV